MSVFKTIYIGALLIFISSCNEDPCDVRHTVVNGECIPDYIFPENENLEHGAKFYHSKYGVIIFRDGDWFTDSGKRISEMNIKKN